MISKVISAKFCLHTHFIDIYMPELPNANYSSGLSSKFAKRYFKVTLDISFSIDIRFGDNWSVGPF